MDFKSCFKQKTFQKFLKFQLVYSPIMKISGVFTQLCGSQSGPVWKSKKTIPTLLRLLRPSLRLVEAVGQKKIFCSQGPPAATGQNPFWSNQPLRQGKKFKFLCYHAIKNKFLAHKIPENIQGNVKINLWTNLCILGLVQISKIRLKYG